MSETINKTLESKSYLDYLKSKHAGKYGNASFWMEDLVTKTDAAEAEKVGRFDIFKMAQFQKAIGNFVKILAKKDVGVKFSTGQQSKTNGESIIISSDISEKNFDSTCGLALHEASHILYTDMAWTKKVFENSWNAWPMMWKQNAEIVEILKLAAPTLFDECISKEEIKFGIDSKRIFGFLNWIEDRRIDSLVFNSSPGYKQYYHSLYDKYFLSDIVSKALRSAEYRTETIESYDMRITNLMNPDSDVRALKGLPAIVKTLDLGNISRLTSVKDSFVLACQVAEIVYNCLKLASLPKMKDNFSDIADQEQKKTNPRQSKSKDKSDDENYDDDDSMSSKSNSDDDENQDDATVGDIPNSERGDGDSEDEIDLDESGDESAGDGDGSLDIDGDGDNSATDDSQSVTGAAQGNMNYDDVQTTPTDDLEQLSAKDLAKLKKVQEEIKQLVNDNVRKKDVNKSTQGIIENITKDGYEVSNISYDGMNIPVMGIKLTPSMLRRNNDRVLNDLFSSDCHDNLVAGKPWHTSSGRGWNNHRIEMVNNAINLGIVLGKKLKLREEARATKFTRLKHGIIDRRLLHQCGIDNSNIFSHTNIDAHTPSVLHINVDASGSMGGQNWDQTQTAVLAIAKACSMIQSVRIKVSYRYLLSISGRTTVTNVLAYDSAVDKINHFIECVACLDATGSTPDSLCLAFMLKKHMIDSGTPELNSYFLNFSDGEPGCSVMTSEGKHIHYSSDPAYKHTQKCRKMIESLNVKVMSYFIGRYGNFSRFKEVWGKENAHQIDVNNISSLALTLNNMFLAS